MSTSQNSQAIATSAAIAFLTTVSENGAVVSIPVKPKFLKGQKPDYGNYNREVKLAYKSVKADTLTPELKKEKSNVDTLYKKASEDYERYKREKAKVDAVEVGELTVKAEKQAAQLESIMIRQVRSFLTRKASEPDEDAKLALENFNALIESRSDSSSNSSG